MRFIAPFLPVKVHRGIAGIIWRWPFLPTHLLETLQTGAGFQQCAVHRKMFIRHQVQRPGLLDYQSEELPGHIGFQQSIPILGETVTSQTGSSRLRPTNQRNNRLYSNCSINIRSLRTVYRTCNSNARSNFSGGIDRRPMSEYIFENNCDSCAKIVSAI